MLVCVNGTVIAIICFSICCSSSTALGTQNSTTALVGSTDSCNDITSDMHTFSEAFGGSVSKSSSYDHLAKTFKSKEPSSLSHQNSYRSHVTEDSISSTVNKFPQSYESSIVTRDEELLDDFDYDEIEDTPNTDTSTRYSNLVHSGKEHRLSKCTGASVLCFDHILNQQLFLLYIN